jgi:DNA-binding transcriptional MerR regulator
MTTRGPSKQPKDYLFTSDVMAATKVGRDTLRFYEDRGLIKVVTRTAAGYRQFNTDVVERIEFIKQTQQAGFTLKEIQNLLKLRDTSTDTCGVIAPILNGKLRALEDEIRELEARRAALSALATTCGLSDAKRGCDFVRRGPGCC